MSDQAGQPQPELWPCPRCQARIPSTSAFCPNCGYQLVQQQMPQPSPGGPPGRQPATGGWSGRKKAAVIIGVVVVLLVVASALRGQPGGTGGPRTTPEPPAAGGAPRVTPAPRATPPPQAPQGLFSDINRSGSGNRVERIDIPASAIAIADISHRGSRNFAVWTLDEGGSETDLLVNTIGTYRGTVMFDETGHSAALKIEADGNWTISIKHLSKAKRWNPGQPISGAGDDVLRLDPLPTGLTTVTLTHTGSRNFAIFGYGDRTDLLVNEIGRHSGQTTLRPGTLVLEITADGQWSITPD